LAGRETQAICLFGSIMMQAPQAIGYRIVVEGIIDPVWFASLGGLHITEQRRPGRPAFTQLKGLLADQSALHGVLDTLFMLGLRLVFVERLPANKLHDIDCH
jgi:hypothetical protein